MNQNPKITSLRKQLTTLSSTYYELAMDACEQRSPEEVYRMVAEQRACLAKVRRLEMMYPEEGR